MKSVIAAIERSLALLEARELHWRLSATLLAGMLLAGSPSIALAQGRTGQAVTLLESGAGADGSTRFALEAPDADGRVLRSGALRMSAAGRSRVFRETLPVLRAVDSDTGFRSRGKAVRRQPSLPSVRLQLFPDTVFTFQPDRVTDWLPVAQDGESSRNFGRVLHGVLTEGGEGTVVLSEYDGAVSGAVRLTNGEYYELEIYPGKSAEVRQLRPERPAGARDEVVIADRLAKSTDRKTKLPPSLLDDARARFTGEERVITVTMFYTSRVLQRHGGPAGLRAFAGRLEEESSEVLRNSEVPAVYRIVALRMLQYDDSKTWMNWTDALYRLEEYFGKGEATGTRLATLLVNPPLPPAIFGYTMGIAFQRTLEGGPERLSVVHQHFSAGPNLVFAHEAGHSLGCSHDVANGGEDGGLYGDSRGYQQTKTAPLFHTVMAYPCAACLSIPYYSEPKVLYETVPTGTEGARCAETLAREIADTTSTTTSLPEPRCTVNLFPGVLYVGTKPRDYAVRVETEPDCEWRISGLRGVIDMEDLDNNPLRKGPGLLRLRTPPAPPWTPGIYPMPLETHLSIGNTVLSVFQTGEPWQLEIGEGIKMRASATPDSPQEACTVYELGGSADRHSYWNSHDGGLAPWMTFSSAITGFEREVCIRADTSNLPPGTYGHVMYFELSPREYNPRPHNPWTNRTGHSITIPVEVEVTESVEPVRYTPRAISFHWRSGEALPGAQHLELDGPDSLTLLPPTRPSAWLQMSMIQGNGGPMIRVSVRPQILGHGNYEGEVRVGCPDGACTPRSIPVRLRVTVPSAAAEPDAGGPRIASGGVVNAASFAAGLSPGSWMSIFGDQLAPTSRGWSSSDFTGDSLPTRLDNVRVRVDGVLAAISFISPGQVNFQCPQLESSGWVPLEISNSAGSHTVNVWAEAANPGAFLLNGQAAVAALHTDAIPAAAIGALGPGVPVRPARPGDVLALYGTGLGNTDPVVPPGQLFSGAASLPSSAYFKVYVGGEEADILFAGLSGAGLNQINLRVPDLPPGDYPVRLVSGFQIGPSLGLLHVTSQESAASEIAVEVD